MESKKTIGLVLGGGAARGYAHIGAIQAIQEAGLEPDAIVGSSMGGVFGALLAHGMTPTEMLGLAKTPSRFRIPGFGRRGDLLSNLPVDLIGERSRSPVVAIDVGLGAERRLPFDDDKKWLKKLATRLSRRFLTAELLTRAVEIPQAQLTAAAVLAHPPDLRIVVDFPDGFRLEHFHRADEAFEYGYESAQKALAASFGRSDRDD